MFWQIRFQTGEIKEVIQEMKSGKIPCVDVDDYDELEWFINKLAENGIYRVEGMPYDKDARDRVKEPEFEFRVPFFPKPVKEGEVDSKDLLYIDFYFAPFVDETYDSIGEI